jgi:hypothetical protein
VGQASNAPACNVRAGVNETDALEARARGLRRKERGGRGTKEAATVAPRFTALGVPEAKKASARQGRAAARQIPRLPARPPPSLPLSPPREFSRHPSPALPATSGALASQRTQLDRAVGKEGGGRPEQGEARAPPLRLLGCVLPSPPWRGDSYFFRPPSFFLASPSLGLFD